MITILGIYSLKPRHLMGCFLSSNLYNPIICIIRVNAISILIKSFTCWVNISDAAWPDLQSILAQHPPVVRAAWRRGHSQWPVFLPESVTEAAPHNCNYAAHGDVAGNHRWRWNLWRQPLLKCRRGLAVLVGQLRKVRRAHEVCIEIYSKSISVCMLHCY